RFGMDIQSQKSYLFLHDRFLSACGSELWLLLGSQLNPRPAHWCRSLHFDYAIEARMLWMEPDHWTRQRYEA
ncbi:MAG: hypothetical protein ACYDBH_16400, partial [Acidobacteriaceae bacterium]